MKGGAPSLHFGRRGSTNHPFQASDVFVPFIASIDISFYSDKNKPPAYDPHEIADHLSPLWNGINRYRSLTSVSVFWPSHCGWEENEMLYKCLTTQLGRAIYQATAGQLSRSSCLTSVELQVLNPISRVLQLFSSLEELSLHLENTGSEPPQLTSLFGGIVLRNPGLRSLRIECDFSYPLCAVEDLLPPGLEATALETIFIRGALFNNAIASSLSSLCSPMMKNLRYLNIHFGGQPPPDAVNLDQLWHTLKSSGARLLELSLDYGTSDALVEYLSSFDGLRLGRFKIRVPSNGNPFQTHSFAEAIRRHAPSLTELMISPGNQQKTASRCRRDMTLDPIAWPQPSSFLQLTSVYITTQPHWELNTENL